MSRAAVAAALVLAGCFYPERPASVPDEVGNDWMVIECGRRHPADCLQDAAYWCPDGYRVKGDETAHDEAAKAGEILVRCKGHGRE